jgi:hypothetical protein
MDNATMQRLVDRIDIQDLLTRYAASCDAKDYATLRALFTSDAKARYDHVHSRFGAEAVWIEGGDNIVDWIEGQVRDLDWQHHMVSVYSVDIDGDEASALVYLISHQTKTATPDVVLMMTSRYTNSLRRIDGRWRIAGLDLQVGWSETRNANQTQELP